MDKLNLLKVISKKPFRAEQPEDLLALKPAKSAALLRCLFFDTVGETDLGDRSIGLISPAATLTLIHCKGL